MNTYLTDKYFRDLDAFNKLLVPHKLTFFKSVEGLSFFNFLHNLSYNLDMSSPNYRWGKRYFSQEYNDFKWVTSTDKKIDISVWNVYTHSYEIKNVKAYFTEKMLNDHFLSCYKKNRKIKFYYKLTPLEQQELKNHKLSLSNMYRVDNKTYGSTQQFGSDILLIDIDNYEERSALETLSMFLDYTHLNVKDLIYLEQNVFTGGIHTALKLPHKIENSNFYSELISILQQNDIKIECNFINNILRFPLSFEYVAIKKDEDILNYDVFIPNNYWEDTFENYINNMNWNICNSQFINELIIKTHLQNNTFNKFENYWKTKKSIIKRANNNKFDKNKFEFYKIKKGCRYDTMSKLIPFCKMQGYSLEETANIILQQNESSKDLNKWSYSKLINNIKKFYDKCPSQIFTIKKSCGYISNIDNLPTQTLEFLNSEEFKEHITNRFIRYYIEERNKHNLNIKNLSEEKIQILKKQIPYFVKEIIGKMFYDINHEKAFTKKEIKEKLGFQLSDTHLKAIQEQSIIDLNIDSPLGKTSLQYLKKALLRALSLNEIQYKSRKRNWMLGSCKSYNIININDLINLLNHLYNSIYNKKINYQLLNKLLISYILLKENIRFDDISEKYAIPKYMT